MSELMHVSLALPMVLQLFPLPQAMCKPYCLQKLVWALMRVTPCLEVQEPVRPPGQNHPPHCSLRRDTRPGFKGTGRFWPTASSSTFFWLGAHGCSGR